MSGRLVCVAALALPLAAWSCGGDATPATPTQPSELAMLAAQAEALANRADAVVGRPWAARLEFPKRLHVRAGSARAFAGDAAAATKENEAQLVERGRVLAHQNQPFEHALALLDRLSDPIEQVTGFQRLIGMHLQALETQGEAPFRIRVDHLGSDAALGFKHLDEALAKMVVKAPDAQTHENIATGTMRRVLETATRLAEETKTAAGHVHASQARERLLTTRVAWADTIVAKAGDAVPAPAREALGVARTFAKDELPPRQAAVMDKLRNAQPDANTLAEALAKDVDAVLERLTRAFLDAGRKAGIPDPQ